MRSIFTSEDMKNICEQTFNGNLLEYLKYKNTAKAIAYVNENSENIIEIDAESGEQTAVDLAEALNIRFYAWRKRLVDSDTDEENGRIYSYFDEWAQGLNLSMNRTYALVETLDESVVASEDINSATKNCQITFLCPINNIDNLDYYCAKIRAKYLGKPQEIQDSFGNLLTAYILWGTLIYDEEPTQTQIGECLTASLSFKVSYINKSNSYANMAIKILLGDTFTAPSGTAYFSDITLSTQVGTTAEDLTASVLSGTASIITIDNVNYYVATVFSEMPITNMTAQAIIANNPLPKQSKPYLTGFIGTSISGVRSITFYEYLYIPLASQIMQKFYKLCAYASNDGAITEGEVNIPIYYRIYPQKGGSEWYDYKDTLVEMSNKTTNGDFNIITISSKTWGLN